MYVVGIAGGSGSGKSTITDYFKKNYGKSVVVINHDNYYKKQVGKTYEERCSVNYDSPEAFDSDLMVRDIKELMNGNTISCPVYDFTIHNRSDKRLEIEPKDFLFIDGILVLAIKELRELMDLKIYVDVDADERILRRIERDVCERERSLESVISQYRTTVKPMHELYVEPSKEYADIIIPGGGRNITALNLISCKMANYFFSKGDA